MNFTITMAELHLIFSYFVGIIYVEVFKIFSIQISGFFTLTKKKKSVSTTFNLYAIDKRLRVPFFVLYKVIYTNQNIIHYSVVVPTVFNVISAQFVNLMGISTDYGTKSPTITASKFNT